MMIRLLRTLRFPLASIALVAGCASAWADTPAASPEVAQQPAGGQPATTAAPAATPAPKYPPFADVVKDSESVDGLIKLHHKGTRLYAELGSQSLGPRFYRV